MQLSHDVSSPGSSEFHNGPLLRFFKELTGITIPEQKATMVQGRLRKRLAELDHPTCSEYLSLIRRNPQEQQTFINLLTTNETSFFRTPRIWKYFRETFLPNFTSSNPLSMLSAWSAAASTGEEACSIAISCNEHSPRPRYHILATDVDTNVLGQAKKGEFCARTVEKLQATNPELAKRYFRLREQGCYQANAELMRRIQFTPHNLMHESDKLGPHHIVFLRNVLIYFRPEEQARIIRNVALTMKQDAILILGESESITSLDVPFTFVEPQVYRRTL